MKKRFIRSSRDGSVLILVVFVSMLLSLWVLRFAQGALTFQREEADLFGRKSAYHAARAGLEYALFLLERRPEESGAGSETLGEARFSYRFANEDGKWDVNGLVDGDGNLVAAQAEGISSYLEKEGWGKKNREIVEEAAGYARGGVFQTAGELALLPSVGGVAEARRLRRGLTPYSAGKVNVNTASEGVLRSLSPRMTETVARGIARLRGKKPFGSVAELRDVLGMSEMLFAEIEDRVDVRGKYYTVVVRGVCGGEEVKIGAVARRLEEGMKLVFVKEPLRDEDLLEVD